MVRALYILSILIFVSQFALAQYTFPEKGKILFERKINTHAVIPEFIKESEFVKKEDVSAFLQRYKSDYPQFLIDSFQLFFYRDSTFYQPAGRTTPFLNGTGIPMAEKNKVAADLLNFRFIADRNAYNESRIVADSLQKIKWKLTDETREIAGYECRRANGLILDSIYIVAFYTDAIKTKGGPELFHGLPGMILGVAVPHFHISYFATKVETELDNIKLPPSFFVSQANKVTQNAYYNEMIRVLREKRSVNEWIETFIRL